MCGTAQDKPLLAVRSTHHMESNVNKRLLIVSLVSLVLMACVLATPRPTTAPAPTPVQAATATTAPEPTATVVATPSPAAASQTASALPWSWDDLAPYRQAMLPAFAGDVDRFADTTRYAIDVDISPQEGTFRGTALVRYTNHEDEALSEVVFRLLPNTPGYGGAIAVSSVTVDGQETRASTQLAETALSVPLAEALVPGESVEEVENVVLLLARDGHLGMLEEVIAEFEDMVTLEQLLPVTVTTAIPLTEDEQSAMMEKLKAVYGNRLKFGFTVDPDILGGVVVRVGGKVIDDSVAARLSALREKLGIRPA